MGFYEITVPYYALIKAENAIEATKKYIEVVYGSEDELDSLLEKMFQVNKYYATGRLTLSVDIDSGEHISTEDIIEVINSEGTEILLVDGALL